MLTYSSDACGDLTGQAPAASVAAPQIIGQPVDQLVGAGDFASFSVVVSVASGVTFQWAFNATDVTGATGDSLLLAAVSAADVGQYLVTVTNSAGTVTSSPATLALDSGTEIASPQFCLAAYSDVGGSVTVTPFQRGYSLGEPVTLTATASAPGLFVGWSEISTGDLLATTDPVIVMMTADTTVRARFAAPVPLAEGMVAFWHGENDATDLIGGYSGTFYTGTTITAPSVTPWGKVGSAFAFDGTNYVQIPDAPGLQPPQLTLEAWVFPTVLSSTSYQTVIGRGSPSTISAAGQWWLGVFNGIPQIQYVTVQEGNLRLTGPAAIPLNEWTHLAATFDGATMVLFVNGIQVVSQGGGGALVYAPAPVGIGATRQDNAPADLFTGLIDEVSLYDRALSGDEIFDIYNADVAGKNVAEPYFTTHSPLPAAFTTGTGYTQQLATVLGTAPVSFAVSAGALPPGMTLSPAGIVTGASTVPGVFDVTVAATDASGNSTEQLYVLTVVPPVVPPPGLVSWWRGEATTSAVVLDSMDGNNGGFFTGTTPTSPSYTPDGEVGGAFAFTGTNYVQIPDAPGLQPPQLTLEMWVYPTAASASSQTVIGSGDLQESQTWSLGVANGIPVFTLSFVRLEGPAAIPLNEWTHLAATFDGATMVLFVNGVQVTSQGGRSAIVYGPGSVPVTIGAAWQDSAPADLFTGRIDEVSLYNRALTPAEISGIVAAGASGKSTVGPYITTGLLLPAAMVGQPYTQAFTSVRGTPPVSYALGAATAAPPGLTLTSAGVLSGTPAASGVSGFTVVATDATALSDEQPFTLQAYGQPVVTGISPASGPVAGGLTVTVTGSGFTGATAVTFGSTPATILPGGSDTQLTVTCPASVAGATGAVDVTVTTAGGTSVATSAADQFTYLPVPVVAGVSPASGPLTGEVTVTVTGSGFTGATAVTFGSTPATILPGGSDTQLTVTSPGQFGAGAVDVTVTTAGGTSVATSAPADQFSYLAVPVVAGVSPASGPVAGEVTVTVTGGFFTGATLVAFGSMPATVLPGGSDTQLTVTSPAATASGTVDVRVTTPGGTSATSAADQFTYSN